MHDQGRSIRVLSVDDQPDVTRMTDMLLSTEPGMECVGTASSAEDLEAVADAREPDVILLDLTMPGRDPMEAMRAVLERRPDIRVIVVSGHSDPETVDRAIEAGAWGFLAKGRPPADLLDAIRRVTSGEMAILA